MNLFKITQLLCFCLLLVGSTFAQESEKKMLTGSNIDLVESTKGLRGIDVGLFLENGLHPGLNFGASYLIKERIISKSRRSDSRQEKLGNRTKVIQHLVEGNLGFYNHPNNHFGTFIGIGFTRLRIKTRKMKTFGWSFDMGYLRRIYNIKTYELNEDGTIETIGGAGNNSLMFAIAPTFGKIYGTKKGGNGWHLYFKPNLLIQKYNHTFAPNIAIEIGTTLYIF